MGGPPAEHDEGALRHAPIATEFAIVDENSDTVAQLDQESEIDELNDQIERVRA